MTNNPSQNNHFHECPTFTPEVLGHIWKRHHFNQGLRGLSNIIGINKTLSTIGMSAFVCSILPLTLLVNQEYNPTDDMANKALICTIGTTVFAVCAKMLHTSYSLMSSLQSFLLQYTSSEEQISNKDIADSPCVQVFYTSPTQENHHKPRQQHSTPRTRMDVNESARPVNTAKQNQPTRYTS